MDKSLFCISAYNDNGFPGMVERGGTLQRTGYFLFLAFFLRFLFLVFISFLLLSVYSSSFFLKKKIGFFPGLGWLLSRELWDTEFKAVIRNYVRYNNH